jgi:hypothetical protein
MENVLLHKALRVPRSTLNNPDGLIARYVASSGCRQSPGKMLQVSLRSLSQLTVIFE